MTLKEWLRLWAGLVVLAVVDPGATPLPDPAPDPQADLDLDPPEDETPPDVELSPDDDDPVALKAARDTARTEAAENKAAAERHRLEAETLRRAAPPPAQAPSDESRRREGEDRELADPKIDPNRKWQIEANRTLRETKRATDATLFQAQDLSDKASFDLTCASNKRLAFVKNDVEEELKKARALGQNIPREAMAYYLLGKKAATAPEKKPVPPAANPARQPGPGVRSDVRGNGKMTEHQKRAKRLESVNI